MNKSQVITKEDLELYYSKVRKFKFKDDVKIESLDDIYNNINRDALNSLETFYKKGTTHCLKNRRRSVNDFFILCKTYFPDKTIKDITNFLISKNLYVSYCNDIKKDNIYHNMSIKIYANLEVKPLQNQGFQNCKLTFKNIIE